MTLPMARCKRHLASLWFLGSGIVFFLFLVQSLLGRYGTKTGEAWGWLLPTVMPTLSLIVGVLVIDSLGKGVRITIVDAFLFRLTYCISLAYIAAVLLAILLQPVSVLTPFDIMSQSSLWLGPFQGLVAATVGAFFVKSPGEEKSQTEKEDD